MPLAHGTNVKKETYENELNFGDRRSTFFRERTISVCREPVGAME